MSLVKYLAEEKKKQKNEILNNVRDYKKAKNEDDKNSIEAKIVKNYKRVSSTNILIDLLKEGEIPSSILLALIEEYSSLRNHIVEKGIIILSNDENCVAIDPTEIAGKQDIAIGKIMNKNNKSSILQASVLGSKEYTDQIGGSIGRENKTTIFLPVRDESIYQKNDGTPTQLGKKITGVVNSIYQQFKKDCTLDKTCDELLKGRKFFSIEANEKQGNMLSFLLAKNLCQQNVKIDFLYSQNCKQEELINKFFDNVDETYLDNIKNMILVRDKKDETVILSGKKKFSKTNVYNFLTQDNKIFTLDPYRKTKQNNQEELYIPSYLKYSIQDDWKGIIVSNRGTIRKGHFQNNILREGYIIYPDLYCSKGTYKQGGFLEGENCYNIDMIEKKERAGEFKNGLLVKGIFKAGEFLLKGTFDKNTGMLEGEDCYHLDPNGKKQFGKFKNGLLVEGIIMRPDGSALKGTFTDKLFEGDNCYYRRAPDGTEYIGRFNNGCFVSGLKRYQDGTIKKGKFNSKTEELEGNNCYYRDANGTEFVGEFKKGRLIKGFSVLPNGGVVKGVLNEKTGKVAGNNCYRRFSNGIECIGTFEDSHLVEGFKIDRKRGKLEQVETGKARYDIKQTKELGKTYYCCFSSDHELISGIVKKSFGENDTYVMNEPGHIVIAINDREVGSGQGYINTVKDKYGTQYFFEVVEDDNNNKKISMIAKKYPERDDIEPLEPGQCMFNEFEKKIHLKLDKATGSVVIGYADLVDAEFRNIEENTGKQAILKELEERRSAILDDKKKVKNDCDISLPSKEEKKIEK